MVDMSYWVNKKVYIGIKKNKDKILHFTAIITNVTDKHILFIDKFKKNYCFLIDEIYEIYEKDDDYDKYNEDEYQNYKKSNGMCE